MKNYSDKVNHNWKCMNPICFSGKKIIALFKTLGGEALVRMCTIPLVLPV